MITKHSTRLLAATAATMTLLAGMVGPAAAEDIGIDDITAVTRLRDYVEQVRDFPGPRGHQYRLKASTPYWSVVGLQAGMSTDQSVGACPGDVRARATARTASLKST